MEMSRTIDRNACAYKEIYEILKIFPRELVNKISKDKIEFFYKNMDSSYKYNISKDTFDGKTMLEETAAILTILFRDYWATPEQKEKLVNFTKSAQSIIDKEDREIYNPDNLFKKRSQENKIEENVIQNEVALVEYKESIFRKFIGKIKSIFHLNWKWTL